MSFLPNIPKVISGIFISFAALFGGNVKPVDNYIYEPIPEIPQIEQRDYSQDIAQLGANISAIADFRTSLAAGISSSATTMTLVTFTSGSDSLVIGQTYGFKIGGREYVIGTAAASNQITGMTRGLSRGTATSSISAYQEAWGRGTSVEVTDAPVLVDISNKLNGNGGFDKVIHYQSNLTVASDTDIVSKKYVDGLAFSGAGVIDASTIARGVSELATQIETASSSSQGGSGVLVIPASNATSSYNSATASLRVVVTKNSGKIDSNFLATTTMLSPSITFNGATTTMGSTTINNATPLGMISSATAPSSGTTLTLSGIGAYSDLLHVLINATSTTGINTGFNITFNSDTAADYLVGATTGNTVFTTNITPFAIQSSATHQMLLTMDIMNTPNSLKALTLTGIDLYSGTAFSTSTGAFWRNSSQINSITITSTQAGSLGAGSFIRVYANTQ